MESQRDDLVKLVWSSIDDLIGSLLALKNLSISKLERIADVKLVPLDI